jgi:hypothetical protein
VNDAFASLQSVKDLFWDDASFLIQFQDIAFSAQKESAGHDAFMHLKQLQNEGRTEKEYLQTIEMNQLIDDMKSWRKRDDDNHLLVVNGKMPWLLADTLGGSVPYWGWLVRTQPMDYIYDAPLHNEHYCIYSTNGFSTRVNADGEAVLRPLSCPPPGTEVVIDQSSLITLHNLGLLEKAATYFGKIIIPAPYLSQVLSESSRLVLHQLSLRSSLQEIKTALDDGILSVLPDNSKTAKKPIPYVNEHTVDGEVVTHYYRIKDIIEALHEESHINLWVRIRSIQNLELVRSS